jgi:competence protein ComEC
VQQAVAIEAAGRSTGIGERVRAWADAERGRFAPWLPVCMGAGVVLYFSLRLEPPLWAGAAAVVLCLSLTALAWRSGAGRPAALAGLAVALGFFSAQGAAWRAPPQPDLPRKAVVMTATVRAVDVLPDARRLVLDDVRLDDVKGGTSG